MELSYLASISKPLQPAVLYSISLFLKQGTLKKDPAVDNHFDTKRPTFSTLTAFFNQILESQNCNWMQHSCFALLLILRNRSQANGPAQVSTLHVHFLSVDKGLSPPPTSIRPILSQASSRLGADKLKTSRTLINILFLIPQLKAPRVKHHFKSGMR